MDAMEMIKNRRSIRKFKDQTLSHETLAKVAEAASFAPSWKNSQVARYTIVENKDVLETLAKDGVMGSDHNADIIRGAAAVAVVTMITGRSGFERDGSYTTSKGELWQTFDAGIATQTFCLAAHNYGIGTVIMGIFEEKDVEQIIDVPEGQRVAALIAMGIPDEEPQAPKRKSPEDLLRYI